MLENYLFCIWNSNWAVHPIFRLVSYFEDPPGEFAFVGRGKQLISVDWWLCSTLDKEKIDWLRKTLLWSLPSLKFWGRKFQIARGPEGGWKHGFLRRGVGYNLSQVQLTQAMSIHPWWGGRVGAAGCPALLCWLYLRAPGVYRRLVSIPVHLPTYHLT